MKRTRLYQTLFTLLVLWAFTSGFTLSCHNDGAANDVGLSNKESAQRTATAMAQTTPTLTLDEELALLMTPTAETFGITGGEEPQDPQATPADQTEPPPPADKFTPTAGPVQPTQSAPVPTQAAVSNESLEQLVLGQRPLACQRTGIHSVTPYGDDLYQVPMHALADIKSQGGDRCLLVTGPGLEVRIHSNEGTATLNTIDLTMGNPVKDNNGNHWFQGTVTINWASTPSDGALFLFRKIGSSVEPQLENSYSFTYNQERESDPWPDPECTVNGVTYKFYSIPDGKGGAVMDTGSIDWQLKNYDATCSFNTAQEVTFVRAQVMNSAGSITVNGHSATLGNPVVFEGSSELNGNVVMKWQGRERESAGFGVEFVGTIVLTPTPTN